MGAPEVTRWPWWRATCSHKGPHVSLPGNKSAPLKCCSAGETRMQYWKHAGHTEPGRRGWSQRQEGQWAKLTCPSTLWGLATGGRDFGGPWGWCCTFRDSIWGRTGREGAGDLGVSEGWWPEPNVHFPEPELYSKDSCGLGPSNTADLNSLLTNGKYINTQQLPLRKKFIKILPCYLQKK